MDIKGLEHFCAKHGVKVDGGDQFSLVDFLLQIGERTALLAETRGRIGEQIAAIDKDDDEWGGCPRCGSNVHSQLSECPICGLTLEEAAPDGDVDLPKKSGAKAGKNDVLSDLYGDDEGAVEPPPKASRTPPPDDDYDDILELADDGDDVPTGKSEDGDTSTEDETDDAPEDDLLPLPKKAIPKPDPAKPKKKNPSMTPEATREKAIRREKLRMVLPKLVARPDLALRLKYEDLLMMPGLLDYPKRPTSLGSKEKIQSWVLTELKRRNAKQHAAASAPAARRKP